VSKHVSANPYHDLLTGMNANDILARMGQGNGFNIASPTGIKCEQTDRPCTITITRSVTTSSSWMMSMSDALSTSYTSANSTSWGSSNTLTHGDQISANLERSMQCTKTDELNGSHAKEIQKTIQKTHESATENASTDGTEHQGIGMTTWDRQDYNLLSNEHTDNKTSDSSYDTMSIHDSSSEAGETNQAQAQISVTCEVTKSSANANSVGTSASLDIFEIFEVSAEFKHKYTTTTSNSFKLTFEISRLNSKDCKDINHSLMEGHSQSDTTTTRDADTISQSLLTGSTDTSGWAHSTSDMRSITVGNTVGSNTERSAMDNCNTDLTDMVGRSNDRTVTQDFTKFISVTTGEDQTLNVPGGTRRWSGDYVLKDLLLNITETGHLTLWGKGVYQNQDTWTPVWSMQPYIFQQHQVGMSMASTKFKLHIDASLDGELSLIDGNEVLIWLSSWSLMGLGYKYLYLSLYLSVNPTDPNFPRQVNPHNSLPTVMTVIGDTLYNTGCDSVLKESQALQSVNATNRHMFTLYLVPTGNLVLYNGTRLIWESKTANVCYAKGPYRAMLLWDGLFAVKDSRNALIWRMQIPMLTCVYLDGNSNVFGENGDTEVLIAKGDKNQHAWGLTWKYNGWTIYDRATTRYFLEIERTTMSRKNTWMFRNTQDTCLGLNGTTIWCTKGNTVLDKLWSLGPFPMAQLNETNPFLLYGHTMNNVVMYTNGTLQVGGRLVNVPKTPLRYGPAVLHLVQKMMMLETQNFAGNYTYKYFKPAYTGTKPFTVSVENKAPTGIRLVMRDAAGQFIQAL
ncbi:hypothetical protein HDU78_011327, partial [Chytriomyces hyalinus]